MKNDTKRLVLFLLLAFVPLCIAVPPLNHAMDGLLFDASHAASPVTQLVTAVGMLCPAAANILTRVFTKEGWQNSFLRANFKGNLRFYALAVAIPVIYSLIGALLGGAVYGFADNRGLSAADLISGVLMQVETGVILAFYGLGEELGWRGYMMPKLEKLIGLPGSILAGGVIWGLWHAPLTCSGHNFGTDYAGFPFAGIGLMCLLCTLMNAILTFVTKKTNSVYPAAILHMVNNAVFGALSGVIVSPDANSIGAFSLTLIPIGGIAMLALVGMLRAAKTKPSA